MPSSPATEAVTDARLDAMADDLASVVQALRLMSDAQRRQGELLTQVVVLLTPEEPVRDGPDLGTLLAQLIGQVGQIGGELRQVGDVLDETTQRLPERMAAALDDAFIRAEKRAAAAATAMATAAVPRR